MTVGYRCAACGARVDIGVAWPWRCPRATSSDRAHVLRLETGRAVPGSSPLRVDPDPNPYVAYRHRSAWHAFALANGMDDATAVALVREVSTAVTGLAAVAFTVTPFGPANALSDALGRDVWVKDDTGNVAGSHKVRHLMGVVLHLLVAERLGRAPVAGRPRLAIASCGNAALAAATLAAAIDWPIDVFVPPHADGRVAAQLEGLGASLMVCPRRSDDPPGDPCIHRFREAADAGAIPFTVQGPENSLCLDTGRTMAWEMADTLGGSPLAEVYVQVGGGALATCVGDGLRETGVGARLRAVQTEGCAPLARAWTRALRFGPGHAAEHWRDCMWPWEIEPRSAASGILDDETYDWVGAVEAMAASGGSPIVVAEHAVIEAAALARRVTSIPADATGTAGLAALLGPPDPATSPVDGAARVAVLFTGRNRAAP